MGACFHIQGVQCDNCRDPFGYPLESRMTLPAVGVITTTAPNRVYETMTRVDVGPWRVRVWRSVGQFAMGPDAEIETVLSAVSLRGRNTEIAERIAASLGALSEIAAYEILDANGNGALVYPDWS